MMFLSSNHILSGWGEGPRGRPQTPMPRILSSPRLSILGLLVPPPCPKHNSFLSPGVASQEPRREEAICHVLHIICPLMAREQVGHQEVLGRRAGENQAGSPSAAQRNVETRSGISGWDLASFPPAGSPGVASFGLNLLPGRQSSPQDRVCLEWETPWVPSVQGWGWPSAGGAGGAASCGVVLGWSLLPDNTPLRPHTRRFSSCKDRWYSHRSISEATCAWSGSILNFL